MQGGWGGGGVRDLSWESGVIAGGTWVLLPTGSEEREVLGFVSIPVVILPSCQDM